MPHSWHVTNIPSQGGKVAIVTGVSVGGIGYEVAHRLAEAGATVVLATRTAKKGHEAMTQIKADFPEAEVCFIGLDLTSLSSIRDFAEAFKRLYDKLDILINNAGVMALPKRELTAEGFELQFGTNHLGHYALTALLIQPITDNPKVCRVVTVSSKYAAKGKMDFDHIALGGKKYKPWKAYANSKLANLLFAFELQRQSDSSGWGFISLAAHPGYARTHLIANGPGRVSCLSLTTCLGRCFSQSAAEGAVPILYAATAGDVTAGGYYGPTGCHELKGRPGEAVIPPAALNKEDAKRLWDLSAELTKVEWPYRGRNITGSEDAKIGAGETVQI